MPSISTQTPKAQLSTFADLLLIPEERRRHEILDGEIVQKALPRLGHGAAQGRSVQILRNFNRRPNGPSRPGGWWLVCEPTIRLSMHEVVQPDVAGWRRDRLPQLTSDYPVELRPDWVCEIMGDGDARRHDGLQKRRIYADHGVPFYWLVDTERESLTVLSLTDRGYVELLTAARPDRVRAVPFDLIELQVGVLFGDDEE
jgi:Uma2 family endonuclease